MMVGYMDEPEDDPSRRMRLVASIRRQCVNIPSPTHAGRLADMTVWCTQRFGEPRPYHPIHEAEEGWMDYFEGDWASARLVDGHGDSVVSFWFLRSGDQTLFKLTWAE